MEELSEPVKKILSFYESDNPGTKANLARILLPHILLQGLPGR